eukprot:jgi/Botrbrau1/3373/Bobra.0337s0014.1
MRRWKRSKHMSGAIKSKCADTAEKCALDAYGITASPSRNPERPQDNRGLILRKFRKFSDPRSFGFDIRVTRIFSHFPFRVVGVRPRRCSGPTGV